jgi:hypothetical protein
MQDKDKPHERPRIPWGAPHGRKWVEYLKSFPGGKDVDEGLNIGWSFERTEKKREAPKDQGIDLSDPKRRGKR